MLKIKILGQLVKKSYKIVWAFMPKLSIIQTVSTVGDRIVRRHDLDNKYLR